jgi:hypothetical protein
MNARDYQATGHDVLVIMIWIGTLGKLLVRNGTLKKTELNAELALLRNTCPPETQLEIDNMLQTIASW